LRADFSVATRPLWTPDGSSILFWGSKEKGANPDLGWWASPVGNGDAVRVTSAAADFGNDMLKFADPWGWREDRIVFTVRHEDNLLNVYEAPFDFQTWRITDSPHRLTFGTTQEESPSVAADGSLAFASISSNLDVYILPLEDKRGTASGPAERLTRDLADDDNPFLSADGSLVAFQTLRSGHSEVWIKHLADGKEERLADGRSPAISPDGANVVFLQDLQRLMIIPSTGGVSRKISDRPLTASAWSPDQSTLLIGDYKRPKTPVEILDMATGKTSEYLSDPQANLYSRGFSPDGRWISFSKVSSTGQLLMIAPFRPSAPPPASEWVPVTGSLANESQPRWSANGQFLYFISERDGFACIWARRMDPATQKPLGEPFPVLHLHGSDRRMRVGRFLTVAKGKLAFTLEERAGSIWTLRFK
jgi:Tol biopolymer transport system component